MSLQYVWCLIVPERQVTRNAKGRYGHQRTPMWPVKRARALLKCDAGSTGAGWTDEAIADALDVSAGSVGRCRCQAVAEGPRRC